MPQEMNEKSELDLHFEHFLEELEKEPLSRLKAVELEHRFLKAIQHHPSFKSFEQGMPSTAYARDAEIVLDMEKLLKEKHLFSLQKLPENAARWASGLALSAVGVLFITIGFVLIVSPASPEFEIATIFYFNEYDGFTVMDLFSLVLIFVGIYFFIRAFIAKENN